MGIVLKNNAKSVLMANISSLDTTVYVDDTSSFPALGVGDYFYCTIESTTGTYEIVKVTQVNLTNFIVERGQEDTIAVPFNIGARVELRITVQSLEDQFGDLIEENISDEAYNATAWNGVTTDAPSKNAVRDKVESIETEIADVVADVAALTDNTAYTLTNIDALQAQTWSAADAPNIVILEYNHNANDGGGMFAYDSSDTTSADNNGTIILTSTSGTALRYKRMYTGDVHAVWFGLVADNDDAKKTANRTAITSALAVADVVIIPPGTTRFRQFSLASGKTLKGLSGSETILMLGDNENTRGIVSTSTDEARVIDITVDMNKDNNTGSGAHDGVYFSGCTNQVVDGVKVLGGTGTFSGSPVGSGIAFINGSGGKIRNSWTEDCFDGFVASGHVGGEDRDCMFYSNERFGNLIAAGSHGWKSYNATATFNTKTYDSGCNFGVIDSDDCEVHSPDCSDAVTAQGFLAFGADRIKTFGGKYDRCGVDGLGDGHGILVCEDPQVFGGSAEDNNMRGFSCERSNCKYFGPSAHGSGDADIHTFRSENVEWNDAVGDVGRVDDAAVLDSAAVANVGSGYTDGTYTVTVLGGTGFDRAQFPVTITGGAVSAVGAVTNGGDHWVRPANPVSVSGLPAGTGATFNLTWSGIDSNTCAGLKFSGGGEGMTLRVDGGFTSPSLHLDNWKGTLTDNDSALAYASGCTNVADTFISDTVYGSGWNGVTTVAPSKNAVYDKIEALIGGAGAGADTLGEIETILATKATTTYVDGKVDDTAYAGSWNGVTTTAPSKNAVYDAISPVIAQRDAGQYSSFRNRLINGSFNFNQRQVTAPADDTYVNDRWYVLTQSAAITSASQSNQEDGQITNIRLTQSDASAQRMGLAQIIETNNCQDLRGRSVVMSGRVRCSSSQAIRYAIVEWTGTANTVTSDIVNTWTSTTYTASNFFIASTTTVATGTITPAANTWTALTDLTGTVSSSMNNLIVFIWTDGTAAQNVTLDMGLIQLEVGSVATPYERRPFGQELSLVQRYFEKSFTLNQVPASSVSGSADGMSAQQAGANNNRSGTIYFKVPKRVAPTVTLYNPGAAGAQARDFVATADCTSTAAGSISINGFNVFCVGAAGTAISNPLLFHWTAENEL